MILIRSASHFVAKEFERALRSQSPVGAELIHFWLAQRRGEAHGSDKRADDEKNT